MTCSWITSVSFAVHGLCANPLGVREQAGSAVFTAYRSGMLEVVIDDRNLSLDRASETQVTIESRTTTGKILLEVP